MKKTLLLMFAFMASVGMSWAQENLARIDGTVATATETYGVNPANAIDGNTDTRFETGWNATGATEETTQNVYFQLTWTSEQTFNTIKMLCEGAMASNHSYKIQTSTDGNIWNDIKTITDANTLDKNYEVVNLDEAVTTKYLRFQGTASGQYGYSFYEFEVYNYDYTPVLTTVIAAGASEAYVGENVNFTYTTLDQKGNSITPVSPTVSWSVKDESGNETVGASITAAGVFTSTVAGSYKVCVTVNDITSDAVMITTTVDLNIAKGKTVTFVQEQDGAVSYPTNITDGKGNDLSFTEFSNIPKYDSGNTASQAKATVDLGAKYNLSEVKVSQGTFHAVSYEVAVSSDGETYSPIYAGTALTTPGFENVTIDDVSKLTNVRYIRFIPKTSHDYNAVRLSEIMAYELLEADDDKPTWDPEAPLSASSTYNTITLTMKATDASSLKYTITEANNLVDEVVVNGASGETSYTFTNLPESTSYTFNVRVTDRYSNTNDDVKSVEVSTKAMPVPSTAAPTPANSAKNVFNIYSEFYGANVTGLNFYSIWDNKSENVDYELATGDNCKKVTKLGTLGMQFASTDMTGWKSLHLDIFPVDNYTISITVESGETKTKNVDVTADTWNSLDLDLTSDFGFGDNNLANTTVVKLNVAEIAGSYSAILYLDNVYFVKTADAVVLTKEVADENGIAAVDGPIANAAAFDAVKGNEVAYDLTGATITDAMTLAGANPNAVFIVTAAQKTLLAGTNNMLVYNSGANRYEGDIKIVDQNNENAFATKLNIYATNMSYTREGIAADKYVTVSIPFTAAVPTGFSAYYVAASVANGSTTVTFNKKTDDLTNQPYVIHNITEASKDFVATAKNVTLNFTESDVNGAMKGVYTAKTLSSSDNAYVLKNSAAGKAEFHKANGVQIGAFRGYLYTTSPARALTVVFDDGDETTSIAHIDANGEIVKGEVYNLQGQRVQNARKGLYIVNGKKVVMK